MVKGLRYQHRQNCTLVTPHGDVELDEEGNVANLDQFDPEHLLAIDGFIDAEVFGEVQGKPRTASTKTKGAPTPAATSDQGPTDADIWGLIKELTARGANLNSEGYIQMEALTPELRERGWPPISGTRRIRITDEGRAQDKAAEADATS
jgi:hypothetical protein